jgi:hypothetical protein
MKVLVACEESQAVTIAFRNLGYEAFSCDLLPCSGEHPQYHYQCSVFDVIDNGWDLMIAHPPCTFLAGSAVQWLSHPEDKKLQFSERRPHPKYPNRRNDMYDSVEFVKKLFNCNIKHIAIENPVGLLSSLWIPPTQIIQPYYFKDEATKTTCLWLKNLPKLYHNSTPNLFGDEVTHVGKGERTVFKSGKSHPKWYADAMSIAKTKQERQTLRSKTFNGIANAMATQWGEYLEHKKNA